MEFYVGPTLSGTPLITETYYVKDKQVRMQADDTFARKLTQNIYSLGEKLRTVLWLVGWFIFHGSKYWWFTCDPEIWWRGHLKRNPQHVKNWLHPFTTTITLQSMHHSPTKTNAATASSECSQYWPRQPVAAGRCQPQPQQQPLSRPAGHIIMYSNNESMHDTFLKGVPKYNQTQISILMATKQGENIQF